MFRNPGSRVLRLGPRPFSVGAMDSLDGVFVGLYISIHAPISSLTVPPLSLSGVNYRAYRFRLWQQSDASSDWFNGGRWKTDTIYNAIKGFIRLAIGSGPLLSPINWL